MSKNVPVLFLFLVAAFSFKNSVASDLVISTSPLIIEGDSKGVAAELFDRVAEFSARYGSKPSVKQFGTDVQTTYNVGKFEVVAYQMQSDPKPTYQIIFEKNADVDAAKGRDGHYYRVYIREPISQQIHDLLAKTGSTMDETYPGHPEMGMSYFGTTAGFNCSTKICVMNVDGK